MGKRFASVDERREYYRKHYRINKTRGKASEQICVCGSQAAEWAQRHGSDGWDPKDYDPMCRPCHQRYDDRWNESERARVAESVKRVWAASPERRREMSVNPHRNRAKRR